MKAVIFSLIILTMLFLQSCKTENVTSNLKKELIIVSDYLEAKDSTLFSNFSKEKNIHVQVKNMDVNKIIGTFRNSEYGTGIDIIMLKSLYDVNRLAKLDFFNSIGSLKDSLEHLKSYTSFNYNYVGFAINPYVLAYNPDSLISSRTYGDLINNHFYSRLSDEELIPMLAPIMGNFNKVESNNWIKNFNANKKSTFYTNDSIEVCLTTLTKHHSRTKEDSVLQLYSKLIYPNSQSKGTFYDLYTMTIVKQAENFTHAKAFILYYTEEVKNKKLAEHFQLIPTTKNATSYRFYKVKSTNLLQYYSTIRRLLNKIN